MYIQTEKKLKNLFFILYFALFVSNERKNEDRN